MLFTRLREHPELIPAAIEEQLRFVSPVQGFYRTATRDYTVGAQTIPAGARVLSLFAAANRDPRRFDDPDTFDLNRNPSDHLAFGGGIHYCLGTPLSRLEASRVLANCFRGSMPSVSTGDYRYLDNPTMRGLAHLPLELVPTRKGVTGSGPTMSVAMTSESRETRNMHSLTARACRASCGFVQRRHPTRARASCCDPCWGRILLRFYMRALCNYFFSGMGAVVISAQDQQRRRHPFRPGQAEHKAVDADARTVLLESGRVIHNVGIRRLCREESLACELWSTDVRQSLTGDRHFGEMHGCRLIQRRADPRFPCGGMEVIEHRPERVRLQILLHDKAAHRVTDNHRRVGRLSATTLMSSTKSATEQARSGLSVGLLPWPRRLTARAR